MNIDGVQTKDLISFDGTRIRYQDIGKGPVIVFANGLGGTYEAWYYLVEHLRDRFRIISWDYRGLYDSDCPASPRLSVPDHVEDLYRILKAEKVNKALLAGWSMGTQVIFEYALRHPDQVLGLIPICGSAGAPFETALHTGASRYLMPALFHAQRIFARHFSALIRKLVSIPGGFEAISSTGLFWRGGEEVIRGMVDSFAQLDFETYAQIMLEIGRHDARSALADIKAPTLIISATRDFFTPVPVSQLMRDTLPDATLYVIEGGTHYAPLEFPDKINELIDDFIGEKIRFPKPRKKKAAS